MREVHHVRGKRRVRARVITRERGLIGHEPERGMKEPRSLGGGLSSSSSLPGHGISDAMNSSQPSGPATVTRGERRDAIRKRAEEKRTGEERFGCHVARGDHDEAEQEGRREHEDDEGDVVAAADALPLQFTSPVTFVCAH